jgi:hypothetical protein
MMGNFEKHIPEHIKSVETEIVKLKAEERTLDWGSDGHECDCDYCDRQGEGAKNGDPDVEKKAEKLDKKIDSAEHLIESLKIHAKVHGIKIKAAKI